MDIINKIKEICRFFEVDIKEDIRKMSKEQLEQLLNDVKKNYRRLARIYHPDIKSTGDKKKFQKIEEMYEEYIKVKRKLEKIQKTAQYSENEYDNQSNEERQDKKDKSQEEKSQEEQSQEQKNEEKSQEEQNQEQKSEEKSQEEQSEKHQSQEQKNEEESQQESAKQHNEEEQYNEYPKIKLKRRDGTVIEIYEGESRDLPNGKHIHIYGVKNPDTKMTYVVFGNIDFQKLEDSFKYCDYIANTILSREREREGFAKNGYIGGQKLIEEKQNPIAEKIWGKRHVKNYVQTYDPQVAEYVEKLIYKEQYTRADGSKVILKKRGQGIINDSGRSIKIDICECDYGTNSEIIYGHKLVDLSQEMSAKELKEYKKIVANNLLSNRRLNNRILKHEGYLGGVLYDKSQKRWRATDGYTIVEEHLKRGTEYSAVKENMVVE